MKQILLCCLMLSTCYAQQKPYYILEGSNHDKCSMFYIFNTALALLDLYEKYEINGFEVTYNNDGFYFDTKLGPNQWLYYFEPVKVMHEEPQHITRAPNYFKYMQAELALFEMPRKRKEYLIKQYIQLNQEMLQDIAHLMQHELHDTYIIGVDYYNMRNTPKHVNITHNKMSEAIQDVINKLAPDQPYKIFVSTNCQNFVDHLKQRFGKDIICLRALPEKGHTNAFDGKTYLLNIFVLAKTNILICNGSVCSKMAAGCNSNLHVIELAPHWAEYDPLSSGKKLFKLLRYPFKLINLFSRDVFLNKNSII